jgi:hypothetical protein
MADQQAISGYDYKDQHVPSVSGAESGVDRTRFLTAARCVIYASPVYQNSNGQATEFIPIGVIQGYNWQEQRDVQYIYELGSEIPYLVPGFTRGQFSITRMLLFGQDLLNVLYSTTIPSDNPTTSDELTIKSLKDIGVPLNMMFVTFANKMNGEDTPAMSYSRLFRNCWITSRSESISAGQVVTAENISILYEDVAKLEIIVPSK